MYCTQCREQLPPELFRSSSSCICTPCLIGMGCLVADDVARPSIGDQRRLSAMRAAHHRYVNGGMSAAEAKRQKKKLARRKKRQAAALREPPVKVPANLPFVMTTKWLSTPEWRRLRIEALHKYGNRCIACGASPSDGHTVLNVDHVKPRKTHPHLALDINNLQIMCEACNHGKGNRDFDFR